MEKNMGNRIIFRAEGIKKNFGHVHALLGVDLIVHEGEIISLVGENGAGKSTLMNVMTGILQPTSGQLYLDDEKEPIIFKNPIDAINKGVCIVHQEIANCPDISVAENIFMSDVLNSKSTFVNFELMNKKAKVLLEKFDCNIDPSIKVSNLSISQQQIVEIAKALSSKPKVIIFDEPTSSLTKDETITLINIIKDLKKERLGIIYISHRMEEVFELSDTVEVIRDGVYIDKKPIEEVNNEWIVEKMTGRCIEDYYPKKSETIGNVIMKVENYSDENKFHNIGFELKKNEILGFYGLVGAGRSEVMKGLVGANKIKTGQLIFEGKQLNLNNYSKAIKNGIVYLTEDRKKDGLFLRLDVKGNLSLLNIDNISNKLFIDQKKEHIEATKFSKKMDVKCSSLKQIVGTLSGGNQQKIMISKALSIEPKVIILDEPTRGIDIGAKTEIYQTLRKLANNGVGIIIISSEISEIIGLCDRVCVMYEGEIVGEVIENNINEDEIIRLASNLKR
jgi:ribose transport system ATP-binding protein